MALRHQILAFNQQRRRERSQTVYVNAFVRHNFSPLDVLNDRALQHKYRLPRAEIQRLIQIVSPHIQRATRRNYALSPEVQLLAALRFYAVGSFQETVGDGTGLSKASVSRSVAAVTPILLRHARQHIKMPIMGEEVRKVHQGFFDMAGIPRVLGLVDGTLIPLLNPSLVDPSWICRKHFSAINTQVVVAHDGLIVDIVKAARGIYGRSIFLGDSGYPLRSYLITPVTNPASPAEERFNEGHIRTRTHVEQVFGRWKARFRCIHRSSGGLRLSPHKACQVIVVTAMLHNIAVRPGADEPPAVDEEEDDNPPPPPPLLPDEPRAALHQAGVRARQEIINLF
ncbi:putative nuclease HARBI1 [Diretmus argenteus]